MSEHPQQLIITIDGPAGSGKSTQARRLAAMLDIDFLDTGAMYRALALAIVDAGVDPTDEQAVDQFIKPLKIDFNWQTDPPTIQLNGISVAHRIRSAPVTEAASHIAAHPCVRSKLVKEQQRIGRDHRQLVTEGRDQGSVVFPDAQVKFFLNASVDERAARRLEDCKAAGETTDLQQVRQAIEQRDQLDRNRPIGPLTCPDDAIVIDTSGREIDENVQRLYQAVCQLLESESQA